MTKIRGEVTGAVADEMLAPITGKAGRRLSRKVRWRTFKLKVRGLFRPRVAMVALTIGLGLGGVVYCEDPQTGRDYECQQDYPGGPVRDCREIDGEPHCYLYPWDCPYPF